jgi:hypothetical protein
VYCIFKTRVEYGFFKSASRRDSEKLCKRLEFFSKMMSKNSFPEIAPAVGAGGVARHVAGIGGIASAAKHLTGPHAGVGVHADTGRTGVPHHPVGGIGHRAEQCHRDEGDGQRTHSYVCMLLVSWRDCRGMGRNDAYKERALVERSWSFAKEQTRANS